MCGPNDLHCMFFHCWKIEHYGFWITIMANDSIFFLFFIFFFLSFLLLRSNRTKPQWYRCHYIERANASVIEMIWRDVAHCSLSMHKMYAVFGLATYLLSSELGFSSNNFLFFFYFARESFSFLFIDVIYDENEAAQRTEIEEKRCLCSAQFSQYFNVNKTCANLKATAAEKKILTKKVKWVFSFDE